MAVENERYSVYNFRKGKARGTFYYFQFMIECREIWNNNLKVRQSLERGLFQLKFCLMRRMTDEKC